MTAGKLMRIRTMVPGCEQDAARVIGMDPHRRQRIGELNLRDYCLYRAICLELEALDETIQLHGLLANDFLELSTAMRDRRLLVEWLIDLRLPPSSDYSDCGISLDMEKQLLMHSLDRPSEEGR